MGNSGTSTRLLMGLVTSHAISACFTGDASLSKRPMGRVIEPLSQMGASFDASAGGTLPLMMRGALPAVPITYRLPVRSEEHTSELQSLMRISYAVFCLKKTTTTQHKTTIPTQTKVTRTTHIHYHVKTATKIKTL